MTLKNQIVLAFVIVLNSSIAQTTNTKSKPIVIKSCIESTLYLKDTSFYSIPSIKDHSGPINDNLFALKNISELKFLSSEEFYLLSSKLVHAAKNKNALIFKDIFSNKLSENEAINLLLACDSTIQVSFNQNGEQEMIKGWACDTTRIPNQINKIKFYESLLFNERTNMIERETLGYAVFAATQDRSYEWLIFYIVKNNEAANLIRKKLKN